MRRGKRSKVEFISTGEGKRGGIYLPYYLAAASGDSGEFVKVKMTKKVVTWVLAFEGVRVVMEENRGDGRIRKIIVKEEGETVLRLSDLPVKADMVRKAVAGLDGFDTQPFIDVFNKVAQLVIGTSAHEYVRGGNRNDEIKTKGGDDTYFAGEGDDGVDLGRGDDTADYSELGRGIRADLRKGVVNKGKGDKDDVKGVENLVGTDKKDVIRGDGKANDLDGAGGNDVIKGRGGTDIISGGDGRDKLDGGDDGDLIYGGPGNDVIKGGKGSDTMFGDQGEDRLIGGPGVDAMWGGADADVFVLDSGQPDGPDQVHDYSAAQGDRLELDGQASDYSVSVVEGSTEISRDGEVVGVLVGVEAPDVLDDALFN